MKSILDYHDAYHLRFNRLVAALGVLGFTRENVLALIRAGTIVGDRKSVV